ncbi:hypothetical protein [Cyanothece sp. BG0011]|uniref:glycine-rich domain-containing protein n=1 Tax=Cyanothece sp. BG0011 TaxID=2082950 RepID=UPI000D1E1B30|nr:hypothetical protein [Cyanothece sp. BG0011]
MLSSSQQELYDRIQAFSLDEGNEKYSYTQRLMRENNWNLDYTKRVIQEYKKFIFLAVISSASLTPSKIIDKAWHLHLIYTDSYWNQFCPHILGCSLHHYPSHGGEEELEKYHHDYQKTIAIYQEYFGYLPPDDIWCYQTRRSKQNTLLFATKNTLKKSWKQKLTVFILLCIAMVFLSPTSQATTTNVQTSGISLEMLGVIHLCISIVGCFISLTVGLQLYIDADSVERRKKRYRYIPAAIMFTIWALGMCLLMFTIVAIPSTFISFISGCCFLIFEPEDIDGSGGSGGTSYCGCGGACGGSC